MKKILFFLCVGLMIGNAQTPTKTQVETTIAADIPDNTIGFVTPAKLRNVANSILNYAATKPPISHTHTTGEISDWVSAYSTQGDARYVRLNSNIGFGTLETTHAATFPVSSTGIALHNQASQTTNFEVGRLYWNSNVLTLSTEKAGTGSNRNIAISSGTGITFNVGGAQRVSIGVSQMTGMINFPSPSSTGNTSVLGISGIINAATGMQYQYANIATIAQSGTAGYVGYYASVYQESLGSGPKLLIDLGTNSAANGGGPHTSKFSVNNTGLGYLAGGLLINKTTNSGERLQVEGTSRLNGNTYIGGVLTLGVSGDLFLDGDKGFSRYANDLILRPYGTGTSGRIVMQSNDYAHTFFHATANGINLGADADVHPSAALQISSTTKGFLPTRLTASEASAIASPAEGLMLYVTNTNATFTAKGWWGFNGTTWEKLNN